MVGLGFAEGFAGCGAVDIWEKKEHYRKYHGSGANFIFKTRNYSGPVNLQKISVTFFDPNGFISQLNGTPFSFALELKIAYENPANKNLKVGFDEMII
jgi:hypothetical protein